MDPCIVVDICRTRCCRTARRTVEHIEHIGITGNVDVDALADRLLKFSQLSKIFLDGEFEFKNGVFVSWREFTSGAKDLLAKTDSGPKLVTRNSVIEIAHT